VIVIIYVIDGLAMCTIKRDILDTIDLSVVLDDFA
jgi:hypothetical protein